MIKRIRDNKIIWFVISIICCFLILSYRLMNSAIWFDEAVEYFVSKNLNSFMPLYSESFTMYDKIVKTFQPPLYNVLMYFWLLVFDSELGFRMAGVVTTVIGSVGIYYIFLKHNFHIANILMIVYSAIHCIVYYAQECAEYNLMLCLVVWTIAFWLSVVENPTWKNIVLFCLFSILAVYSQYGAAFVIIGMFITAGIVLFKKQDIKNLEAS